MAKSDLPLRGNDIRIINEKLILGLIQRHGNLSQSEAVNLTGLKPPTILRIFANLENDKLITINKKTDILTEKKGRKPVYYKINAKAAYAIGVDFCSTSISVVIVDFNRKPVYSKFIDINEDHTGDSIFELICQMIQRGIDSKSIPKSRILGIGIGAPGKVDISSGSVIFYDRIEGLSDYPLRRKMAERFDTEIFVNNNCSVIAMNEYQYGTVSESQSLVTLLIRSGVGGAFINEGQVLTTKGSTTMEIGHTSIDYNGRQCECGEKGCLQSYLAEPAIIKDIQAVAPLKNFLEIDNLIKEDAEGVDNFIREKAFQMTKGLKMLSRVFSPDTFLIISRSPLYAEKLAFYTNELMQNDPCRFDNIEGLSIEHCAYNPVHAGQGAADLVFSDYFTH
ncbi:ROK family transcriptional regulator [Spirochaeta isovalerica]|uniref:Putative NBD/HSP70 family sugar kinase n=1 Tax=Spirochaeta isovalerica TaxID=150 RepID=A0A841REL1_9SPIO|nr:ROK family transcriptional regulator [Spirochaeta isovalerica]MBB6482515.1 putative NBD/HSP70 family sugar kinase [Spirochaeta isovalerica]